MTWEEVLKKIPNLKEWHSKYITAKFNDITWKKAINELHNPLNFR